jgi:Mn-dependent DtxR family transcriptional regulator
MPSGILVLAKVSNAARTTVSELSSQLRLTPLTVRSDVSKLQEKGWATLDSSGMIVQITGKGREASGNLAKYPEVVIAEFSSLDDDGLEAAGLESAQSVDLDRAIDEAASRAGSGPFSRAGE